MKSKMLCVNTAQLSQADEISSDRFNEIRADTDLVRFVEIARLLDVLSCLFEDDDSLQLFNRSCSSSTVRNFASPESIFAARSARTSPCQLGDSTSRSLSSS